MSSMTCGTTVIGYLFTISSPSIKNLMAASFRLSGVSIRYFQFSNVRLISMEIDGLGLFGYTRSGENNPDAILASLVAEIISCG